MLGIRLVVSLCALVLTAFAGCVGDSGAQADPTKAPEVSSGPAEFDENTGAIMGIVTDDEVRPIGGAQVGLLKSDLIPEDIVVLTDAAGQFTMSRVPVGTHKMVANALGYEAAAGPVEVIAGAVTEKNLLLAPLPTDEPFHRTMTEKLTVTGVMYKATPTCIYEPLTTIDPRAKTCGGVRQAGCDLCETHTSSYKKLNEFGPEWQTIVSELEWRPQTGATGKGFLMDVNAPNITRGGSGSINQGDPKTWYKSDDQSPLITRIDKSSLAERGIPEQDWNNGPDANCGSGGNCDWFFRVFPAYCDLGNCEQGFGPDFGIMVDGTATIHFSFFMKDAAPEGFTALPDA